MSLIVLFSITSMASRALGMSRHVSMLAFQVWYSETRDFEIFIADTNKQVVLNVSRNPSGVDLNPVWSPTNQLGYISQNASGEELRALDLSFQGDVVSKQLLELRDIVDIAWSPTGQVALVGLDDDDTTSRVYVVEQGSGSLFDVTPDVVRDTYSVSWLSNTEVVIEASVQDVFDRQREIMLFSLDNTALTRIAGREPMNSAALVSPEDRTIMFQSTRPADPRSLTYVYLWRETSGLDVLYFFDHALSAAYPGAYRHGHFTVNGRFQSDPDIHLWNVSTDTRINLTNTARREYESVMSNDDRIAFTEQHGVYVLDILTLHVRTIYDLRTVSKVVWSN